MSMLVAVAAVRYIVVTSGAMTTMLEAMGRVRVSVDALGVVRLSW